MPDLHAAFQCAGPRCHHLLRTLPPSESGQCAVHDEGMMRVMDSLMGGLPGEPQAKEDAHRLATLPMRMGVGSQVCDPCNVLGHMGERFAHVAGEAPCSGAVCGDSAGSSRGTSWLLG